MQRLYLVDTRHIDYIRSLKSVARLGINHPLLGAIKFMTGVEVMAALELLSHFMGVNPRILSREESCILEAELYMRIEHEIWRAYQHEHKEYFHWIKSNIEMEDMIMEAHIIRCLINDILQSEAYTLSGIAYYTQTPEEIVEELFTSCKVSPVIAFTRKLIELHKIIRPEIYQEVIKKITPEKVDV